MQSRRSVGMLSAGIALTAAGTGWPMMTVFMVRRVSRRRFQSFQPDAELVHVP